jgi:phage baseplate assembly protein gpV
VTTPDVHVDAPITRFEEGAFQFAPPEVRFDEGAFQTNVEPAQVTVEAAKAPDVNVTVEPAEVTVEAPPPANVTVEAPPPANITVQTPEPQRPRKAHAKREEDGSLTVSYEDEEK